MTTNRRIVQSTISFLVNLLSDIKIDGIENVPETGGCLLSANHVSRMDAPVLISMPIRPDVTAFMAEKYEKHWFFGWFGRSMGFIFIDRSKADFSAFRGAIEAIKKGAALAIAPEGTRSKDGSMIEGKAGVILLAVKTGVPIIPAAVTGTDTMLKKIFTFRRPTVYIKFDKPLIIPPLERENRDQQMQYWLDELMCRTAAMLPEKNRGFYANHPRVKELLTSNPPD